jgi:hypothetical protein
LVKTLVEKNPRIHLPCESKTLFNHSKDNADIKKIPSRNYTNIKIFSTDNIFEGLLEEQKYLCGEERHRALRTEREGLFLFYFIKCKLFF